MEPKKRFTGQSLIIGLVWLIGFTFLFWRDFWVVSIPLAAALIGNYYFQDIIEDKYGKINRKLTALVIYGSAVSCSAIIFGILENNILSYLGWIVSILFPIWGMFIRIKAFSEEFSIENNGLNYNPFIYLLLSAGVGYFTTVRGFSALNLYFTNGIVSLEFALVSISTGMILQTVYLFPDKINKIIPFDLRTKKGYLFMIFLSCILITISQPVIFIFS